MIADDVLSAIDEAYKAGGSPARIAVAPDVYHEIMSSEAFARGDMNGNPLFADIVIFESPILEPGTFFVMPEGTSPDELMDWRL